MDKVFCKATKDRVVLRVYVGEENLYLENLFILVKINTAASMMKWGQSNQPVTG